MTDTNNHDHLIIELGGKRYYKRGVRRGNHAPEEALNALQALADKGVIRMTHIWCSEKGYIESAGHFCSEGSTHLPHRFEMVPDPGEGWETLWVEPYTVTLPLRKDPGDG